MDKLWDEKEKMFFDYDLISGKKIMKRNVVGLLPLMTGVMSDQQVDAMAQHLDKANLCGQKACAVELAPSVGIEEKLFNHQLYWRSPIWININWFLWKALNKLDLTDRARHLQLHMIKLISAKGFYEYYSPLNGKGLGAKDFSWTAALAMDLIGH